ncbi:MAG: hypothetical protein Q9168_004684 [Polycauliona sp. 1 TL-2023]
MDNLQKIPNELILAIGRLVPDGDQKSLRLVCKHLSAVIAPLVFAGFTLQSNALPARWRKFKTNPHIKTLTILAIDYLDPADITWSAEIREQLIDQDMVTNVLYADNSHRLQAERIYGECYEEVSLHTPKCMKRLNRLLQRMPQLEHIIITDVDDELKIDNRRYQNCALPQCNHPGVDHTVLALRPGSGLHRLGYEILNHLVFGLWSMVNKVKSLTIESPKIPDTWDNGFYYENLFSVEDSRLQFFANAFRYLTKLVFEIRYDDALEPGGAYTEDPISSDIARFLSHAKNLVHLKVEMIAGAGASDEPYAAFPCVLGGCVFGELQRLELFGLQSTMTELVELVAGSPKLIYLGIERHRLSEGTWQDTIDHWKQHQTHLCNVDLDTDSCQTTTQTVYNPGQWHEYPGARAIQMDPEDVNCCYRIA